MKKIFVLFSILFFAQSTFACDATILPKNSYLLITQLPVKQIQVTDESILSGQVLSSIFGEKNQIIIKTKNVGKTGLMINDKMYRIEVSLEQKQEWNITNISCLEVDNPPDFTDKGANK